MARKPRQLAINAAYHVTARINRQELIFEQDEFKSLFMDTVRRAKTKYDFKIRNFCIMGNHIHLDIIPDNDVNLSVIMKWILSVFAKAYNRVHNYKGHVWYDRFKSRIIASFQQLANTFRYIANNPVRAGLVNHPLEYNYNGILCYKRGALLGVLDPPDKNIESLIEHTLNNYSYEKALHVDLESSFQDKKPGRKKANTL